MREPQSPDAANVARAAKLDTASLSDAMDRHGINGQCYRIAPRDNGFRMAGRPFTVLYGPAAKPAGTVGDYIDDVAPGSVLVLDNGGRDDVTVWGDILTELAHHKGIAGTVIDGICRDVAMCRKLGYPIRRHRHFRGRALRLRLGSPLVPRMKDFACGS